MIYLFILAICIFVLITLLMPWINRTAIKELRQEIAMLKISTRKNQTTQSATSKTKIKQPDSKQEPITNKAFERIQEIQQQTESRHANNPVEEVFESSRHNTESSFDESITNEQISKHSSLERRFGTSLPVWIGGIALAFAGFFLVKYSIEIGSLTPKVKVTLGTLLALVMLGLGNYIGKRPHIANSIRIAQALSGAGIAVLYAVCFSASTLYQLIPEWMGFIGLLAITICAVILSIKRGAPVAWLGLVGGFLTPIFIGADQLSGPLLFLYFYLIYTSLQYISKQQQWQWLTLSATLAALSWSLYWILGHYTAADTLWLAIFLFLIGASTIYNSKQQPHIEIDNLFHPLIIINYLCLTIIVVLMGVIVSKSGLGLLEWSLFALLTLATIALAYFKEKLYGFLPWVALLVTVVMLFDWPMVSLQTFGIALLVFAIIYAGSSYFIMWRTPNPLLWVSLFSASCIIFYLLAYYRFQLSTVQFPFLFWGGIAFLLGLLSIYVIFQVQQRLRSYQYHQHLLTLLIVLATFFITLGLTIEISSQFMPIALSAEILVIAWLNYATRITQLRKITPILIILFVYFMLPDINLYQQRILNGLMTNSIPNINLIIFRQYWIDIGIPALMLMGASIYFKKQSDGRLVQILETLTVILIVILSYNLTRTIVNTSDITNQFVIRGVITNILLFEAIACIWLAKTYHRIALLYSGIALCLISIFRIIYIDFVSINPFITYQTINGIFIFNTLLLPFGLPVLWLSTIAKMLHQLNYTKLVKTFTGVAFIILFIWINVNVRQLFHGHDLVTGSTTDLEIYTYSLAWLLLGLGLLFMGTIKKNRSIRYLSLIVMMLTIGKVFLYDARALEGFYRVFSFLGLGTSLLALSYFYSRFVFIEPISSNSAEEISEESMK